MAQAIPPTIVPAQPLTPGENKLIGVFERTTQSVVNVFDVTGRSFAGSQSAGGLPVEGNGTGMVWDSAGHIVTNYHVLAAVLNGLGPAALTSAQRPKVAVVSLLCADGQQRSFNAYLTGYDQAKDLAVIQIEAPEQRLSPVQVGSATGLRVGQQVLAVGNPFGFDHTLTTGIVSGLGREIRSQAGGSIIGGAIQTDASINPGNSGGPLLDSGGRVIGVNTAIYTATGTSAGVGFALPIDLVARVVPQLIEFGVVTRPSLRIQAATPRVSAGLKVREGVLVQAVQPGSPAAGAGLRGMGRGLGGVVAGDVVVGINGRRVKGEGDLIAAVDDLTVGDTVTLEVVRDITGAAKRQSLSFAVDVDR